MFKRILGFIAIAVVVGSALTACSADLDHQTLHGEAAHTALTKVVTDSAAAFTTDGGTEQITLGTKQFGIVYDPKAPQDKQVAVFDIATFGPSQFTTTSTIFLLAITKLLNSELFKGATYDYKNSGFTVTSTQAVLTIQVLDGKVNGTLLKGVTAGGLTQATINNYGVNDVAREKLTQATPAPTAPATK